MGSLEEQVSVSTALTRVSPSAARLGELLAAHECVILDGGIATELDHEYGQEDEDLWGTEVLASNPEQVLDVHRRYVAAGADVITTNTWGLATALSGDAHVWDSRREPVHWMEIARRGVRLARQAVAEAGREADCAVAFSLNADLDRPGGSETASLLARAFAAEPPDLILVETLSLIRPSLMEIVEQLVATGFPVWLSFRRCRHGLCGVYGQHWGGPEGDAFGRAARRFEQLGVHALLVNCIPPDHVDGIVSYLRDFTDLPLGVYPNLGYLTNAGWRSEAGVGGEEFAEMAGRWRREGADIIGGCCGTGPEHIAAARAAVAGVPRGHAVREEPPHPEEAVPVAERRAATPWRDRRRRPIYPLPVPDIARHRGVSGAIPGSYLMWRHLFEESVGAHQRCLDIGSGAGLQTVQLARNGAIHVHALDVDRRAVANTLDNAFRNGVAERVTGETVDLFPWLPQERYEVIVATLPQIPMDPALRPASHRPTDFWGRGLFDQVIAKLPTALAPEGIALLTMTSLLSRIRTDELLAEAGLQSTVLDWELAERPPAYAEQEEQVQHVEGLSDAYHPRLADEDVLATYLLEIRRADAAGAGTGDEPPWGRTA